MIKVKEVRVISAEGEQLGILDTRDAIKRAEDAGLDLVEVAPTAKPPVCRIMDFGKYKYEIAKKAHAGGLTLRDAALAFGRGLSTEDEPDLWQRDRTGTIERWIDVGLPDEKAVRKACGRAREVVVLAYGARRVDGWLDDNAAGFARLSNLRVVTLTGSETEALQKLAARSMALTCTIQEGHVWLASDSMTVELAPKAWP